MNVNALLDFQNELLKPFAPSQEFALLTLIVPDSDEKTVVEFCTDVSYKFPQVDSLYDMYANRRPVNAIPLIVPVANSENARSEIFAIDEGKITINSKFAESLALVVSRVPEHVSSPDELDCGAPESFVRITLKEICDSILLAFLDGALPIVEAKKKSGVIVSMWRSIFPTAA